jgi:PAS domain S-box-containing protein
MGESEARCVSIADGEASFAAVFEGSPFAMALTEMPSGRILRVNRAFEDLFGYSRDELVGRTSPELGISDPASQQEAGRRFSADGSVRDMEVQRTARDGGVMTLSLNLDWVRLGSDRLVLTSIRNITEQRRAERALAASERRYRDIVELTGDGLMIGEPDGTIAFVNSRMAQMLGYTADELVGMPGHELIFPDWMPRVLQNRAALDEGEVVRGEFKLRCKDGQALWTVFSSTPMIDAGGDHVGNVTMHSDITELRATQAALRESELVAAAQEERARLARDLHDSITQALFAASLKAEALGTAAEGSAELEDMIREVRRLTGGALAQMRTLLLELRGEPLDHMPIRHLLRNVVEATESRTRTCVSLDVRGEDSPPPQVHVALYRVAQEALNNVARHARAEHAWVDLELESGRARLSVRDDGCGFDPVPAEPGHIGLMSMRERAAETGAEFRLVSAPGAGTEVTMVWPAPGG